MDNTKNAGKKPKSKARVVILVLILLMIAAACTFIYIRVNPKWKAAELTIEPAGKRNDISCIVPEGNTLESRIVPPEGYERVEASEGSFAAYLRDYPLHPDGSKLPVYNGKAMDSAYAAAVFDISLGDEGYQQCADSIIRLYSDYYYENGRYDKISFLFSNGDECSYERWRRGKRMLVFGDFSCEIPAALPDESEQQYRNYLKEVMRYSGTLSLQKESEQISPEELRVGDIICNDSHVVMIADEAVNDKGEKCFLIGQSFIPAVCFHIVAAKDGEDMSPWFSLEQLSQETFSVGAVSLKKQDIRRWKDGF